jgi:hypothetical protein
MIIFSIKPGKSTNRPGKSTNRFCRLALCINLCIRLWITKLKVIHNRENLLFNRENLLFNRENLLFFLNIETRETYLKHGTRKNKKISALAGASYPDPINGVDAFGL